MGKKKKTTYRGGAELEVVAREYGEDLSHDSCEIAFMDGAEFQKQRSIEKACEAYCKVCDTKECEELQEFNTYDCDWVQKFRKQLKRKL